jgi:hypothetical protein
MMLIGAVATAPSTMASAEPGPGILPAVKVAVAVAED